MDNITGEVIAGLLVLVIGGIGTLMWSQIRRRFGWDDGLLPGRYKRKEKVDYTRLGGKWHLYYLTQYPYLHKRPIWIHGIQELKIKKLLIEGTTSILDHPETNITYQLRGEIRGGKMIIADYCLQDETEFATMIYPDLMKPDLVGIWTGLDGYNHLIAAPTILTRVERTPNELIIILQQSVFNLLMAKDATLFMFSKGQIINHNDQG